MLSIVGARLKLMLGSLRPAAIITARHHMRVALLLQTAQAAAAPLMGIWKHMEPAGCQPLVVDLLQDCLKKDMSS